MALEISLFSSFSDAAMAAEVSRLAHHERDATAALVAALAEFDARRLYLPAGCSSLFTYCTQVLHLSEHAAFNRIEAARVCRRHPVVLDALAAGDVTLTTVRLLTPHFTPENCERLLAEARHKSKRDTEQIVAALRPQPDAPTVIRKLPAPSPQQFVPRVPDLLPSVVENPADANNVANTQDADRSLSSSHARAPVSFSRAPRAAVIAPLAPERYKLQFTVSREAHEKLRRAQDLLRHTVPGGDPAEIFDRALTLLVAHLERHKIGASRENDNRRQPRCGTSRTRYIPRTVRRAVWARDDGRCAFVGSEGRCSERAFLEYHHVVPYADGGETAVDNLELRCRRHNQFEADRWFGVSTEADLSV